MSDKKSTDYELMRKLAKQMAEERHAREQAALRMAQQDRGNHSAQSSTSNSNNKTTIIDKDAMTSGRTTASSSKTSSSSSSLHSKSSSKVERFDDISAFEEAFMGGGNGNGGGGSNSDPENPKKKKFNFGRKKNSKKKDGKAATPLTPRTRDKMKPGGIKDKFFTFCEKHPKLDAFIRDLNPNNWTDKHGNPLSRKRKVFKFGVRTVATFFAVCFLYTAVTIITAPSIDPKNIYDSISTDSVMYDQDGNKVDTLSSGEQRTIVKYKDIPENMINAIVALEDKTFWKHHGFNWTRMIGAIVQSVTSGGSISGTSTLTQQLARNVYLPDIMSQRSLRRKIIEMYYSVRIELALSKEEIITAYLNSIYYGYGNYGIESAAKCYFNKDVKDLDLIECAALAALPQSPDTYALIKDSDSSTDVTSYMTKITVNGKKYYANDIEKDRRSLCLSLMKSQGYITEEQYNENKDTDLTEFLNPNISTTSDNSTTYFKDYMADEIISDLKKEYDMDEETAEQMVYSGGLKIYSTLDSEAQDSMNDAFADSSNFPTLLNLNTDSKGNIITDSGSISLYKYSNLLNSKGDFTLKKGEFTENSDGSLTIKAGKRLNIYETTVDSGTDYSIELKPSYTTENGSYYIYAAGYINIPAENKTIDKSGNVTIDAKYIKNNTDKIKKSGSTWVIKDAAITMADKVIQPQGAMVITEVGTGEIKAMIGGRGVKGSGLYNRALNARQPGSSIKPLAVYGAALQKSYDYLQKGEKFSYTDYNNDTQGTKYYGDYMTAGSTIVDEKITFEGKTWPTNSYGGYKGRISMRRAMQLSSNVCAVKIFLQVGTTYSADLVEKFGITTLNRDGDNNDENAAALALGGLTKGVKPIEMAQAYATIANGGVRQSSIAYRKVLDRNGNLLLQSESKSTKVLDEGVAFILTDMMKSVVSKGTGTAAAISGVQAGGKTGTTSNNYDIWFDGFTPHYAAALWVGTDYNIQLSSDSSGAAALWGKIMNKISAAKEGEYPSQPSDVIKKNGEYYIEGTETNSGSSYNNSSGSSSGSSKKTTKKKSSSESSSSGNSDGNSSNSGNTSGGSSSGGSSSNHSSSGGSSNHSSSGGTSGGNSSGSNTQGGGSSGGNSGSTDSGSSGSTDSGTSDSSNN